MNYKVEYIATVIRDRAAQRAERTGGEVTNPCAVVTAPSFAAFVKARTGKNWREVKPYQRAGLYNEYKIGCIECGVMYEHPKIYDLYDTI